MPRHLKHDLTGQRFGRLLVISRAESKDRPRWNCECDCGNKVVLPTESLLGGTKSCGCYRREWSREIHTKHGGSKRSGRERLYSVWNMMKQRCTDPNNKAYKNYGGRGITVCKEWCDSYEKFREWALENGYDKDAAHGKSTIDRIDNEKGYSPDNCRFVDAKTQARNTRTNRFIEYNGETKTLAEWGEETGIYCLTIHYRLKNGWSVEDALTIKPRKGRNQTWRMQ